MCHWSHSITNIWKCTLNASVYETVKCHGCRINMFWMKAETFVIYLSVSVYVCEVIWAASSEKVPNVLSRCHTKRRTGAHGRALPSFGMTPTFQKWKKKSVSYQKKGGRAVLLSIWQRLRTLGTFSSRFCQPVRKRSTTNKPPGPQAATRHGKYG